MKIFVKVKARAKEGKIEKIDNVHYEVWVKELPIKGRANKAVIKLLASYFKGSISQIRLLKGATRKNKIFEIKNIK